MGKESKNSQIRKIRFYIGMTFLILSCICPFFGILVAQTDMSVGLKASLIGLLSLGAPEVLIVIAAAILGKENFEIIKSRSLYWLKRLVPSAKVGRLRYNIGLAMFLAPMIPTYIQAYVPRWLPDNSVERLYINITADVMFIVSLFVLGGDFWEKLRALFVFEAKAQFPDIYSAGEDGKT